VSNLTRLARLPLLAIFCCAFFPTVLAAVEPSIRALDIRGLTIGGTTTLTIDGDDLGSVVIVPPKAAASKTAGPKAADPKNADPKAAAKPAIEKSIGPGPKLMLPFPAKQVLKPGATEKRAVFDVTLADDVAPGYYNLRLTTEGGISLPVVIAVDRLPQQPFPPATLSPPTPPAAPGAAKAVVAPPLQLPVALHGTASGSVPLEASFTGKSGQSITAEIESQRLGGKLRPVVHLYGPKRVQLAWSWPSPSLSGDTRLTAVLPADGTYVISVHDLEYAAPAASYFRLRLGRWSSADRVFPPVVKAGGKGTFELVGTSPIERIDMTSPTGASTMRLPAPKTGLWSGPRPFVQVSPSAEFIEQPAAGKPQELPAVPVGVSGRLLKPYEEDRYQIAVAPGTKLRLEVFAERIGSALDTAIVVRGDKDAILARGEDGPGTIDPTLEYVVPDKTTSITVGVVDALGRGAGDAAYRLFVEPATGGPGDFRLSSTTQRLTLSTGGRVVVPVVAERRGYSGEIELSASALQGGPLPAGVKFAPTKIPAESDGALVTIERTGPLADAAITEWQGRATASPGNTGDIVRSVILKGHPTERLQPWLASEIALAPTSAAAATDFKIEWRGLPADARVVPAKNLTFPITVARADDKLPVRLTLVTSQLPPVLANNNQPDLPKTLRAEKPIELAAKAATGELVVVVPPELSNPTYDVTVMAELLSADKRVVLATAFAPVKRLPLSLPIAVKLTGPTDLKAPLDPKAGATLKLVGKIERREGATGDATVSLIGLPAGINVAPAVVKTGADDFTLTIVLPPTTPPGKLTGLKLSALIVPDPKLAAVRVKSRDVELTVAVEPAPVAPAAPPKK